ERLAEHGRRLLRNDARPYQGHCRRGEGREAAAMACPAAGAAAVGNGSSEFLLMSEQTRNDQAEPQDEPQSELQAATPVPTFINIGERTNVTGSARVKKLTLDGDYTPAM